MSTDPYLGDGPTRQALARVGDKWSMLIVGLLSERTYRFAEMRREVSGISQKMLTQTLRHLERDGLVRRTLYPEVPPRAEYALTPLGRTLVEPVASIVTWAQRHIGDVENAQAFYDRRQRIRAAPPFTPDFAPPA